MSRCNTEISEKVQDVPNQPKTPVRTFRLSDPLWLKLKKKAAAAGMNVSDYIRHLIEKDVK